jgi:hypothetical protein
MAPDISKVDTDMIARLAFLYILSGRRPVARFPLLSLNSDLVVKHNTPMLSEVDHVVSLRDERMEEAGTTPSLWSR